MGACLFHFLAFLAAMVFTYFAYATKADDGYSLSRTNITNVPTRSMEFDAPLLYPPPNSNVRPPYYTSKQHEYEAAAKVAGSMPELMHTRGAYPSDIIVPPRVRRKSETCV